MSEEVQASTELPRRPGPFGPARDLIPENQVLLKLEITDTVATALERLADHGIDAAPVSDGVNITGVFSHREASRVLSQYRGAKVDDFLAESVQAITEEPKFLDPDQWIDTSVNWIQDDWVIVGSAAEPLGILTVSDVWARLNDFAEVFVLLHEIELDIRHLIEKVLGGNIAAHFRLLEARLHGLRPNSLQALTDLSFDQYRELILEKKNGWPAFEPVMPCSRLRFRLSSETARDVRNIAMHHKRPLVARDSNDLRGFHRRLPGAVAATGAS
jgi:CBS domain-containing protein